MNRRGFFQTIGFGAIAAAVAKVLPKRKPVANSCIRKGKGMDINETVKRWESTHLTLGVGENGRVVRARVNHNNGVWGIVIEVPTPPGTTEHSHKYETWIAVYGCSSFDAAAEMVDAAMSANRNQLSLV